MNKISVHSASEENPAFLLWQVSTLWSKCTASALKPLGLTHPQFVILATIDWLKGKKATQEEIGRHVVLDPKTVSHLLRSLQVKKLIGPAHVTDEAKGYLQLTTAGRELLMKALQIAASSDETFFASIDLEDSKIAATLQILACANFSRNDGEPCVVR